MTPHRPDFRLNRPGTLIAALPAVLGFVPAQSLILVAIDRGQMGAVMRVDLSDDVEGALPQLAEVAATSGADAVVAVIVDAKGAGCPTCNAKYRDLGDDLDDALTMRDITLLDVHLVDVIGAGGRWHCVDGCGAGGRLDDPASSPLAMAAVLDGRRLYGTREDLAAVIAVADEQQRATVAGGIEQLALGGTAERAEDPEGCSRRSVQDVLAAVHGVAAGSSLGHAEIAALGYALSDVIVRDILFALATGETAAAAESLFADLSRSLPDPWRAQALTLLAFFAYVRSDGPLAGIALQEALRIDPAHRLAAMLDQALQGGMRPEQIRHLAVTGYRLAEDIGVELPPPLAADRRAG